MILARAVTPKKNIATEKVKVIVANMCYSFILDIDLKLTVGE